jgi:hypothetical protein
MKAFVLSVALVFAAGVATAAEPALGRMEFEVTRNGQPFGRHVIIVSEAGDALRTQSSVSLRARAGPLTVFRYEQTCSETWSADRLLAIECSTLKDGRQLRVRGAARDGQLVVAGVDGEATFPASAFPTSWWRKPPIGASSLLDTETGEPMSVRVSSLGWETIDVSGRAVRAERLRVQGTLAVDLWYDESGRWVGCRFTARGQRIEYRLAA